MWIKIFKVQKFNVCSASFLSATMTTIISVIDSQLKHSLHSYCQSENGVKIMGVGCRCPSVHLKHVFTKIGFWILIYYILWCFNTIHVIFVGKHMYIVVLASKYLYGKAPNTLYGRNLGLNTLYGRNCDLNKCNIYSWQYLWCIVCVYCWGIKTK